MYTIVHLWRKLMKMNTGSVFVLTFFVILLSSLLLRRLEPATFPTLLESVYFVMTTVVTVGYGDYSPKTDLGKLFVMSLYVYGIGLMTLFIGRFFDAVATWRRWREEGKLAYKKKGHLIFIGWGRKVETAVEEILSSYEDAEIVLIDHSLNRTPVSDERVHFIRGDAASEEVLMKANLLEAGSVAIFSDERLEDALSADGKTALIALGVEGVASDHGRTVHTIVELRKSSHKKQFRYAKVDAFIPSVESVALLMVRESLHKGSSSIYSQMLSQRDGANWYEIRPRPEWKTYGAAAHALWDLGANLVAVNDNLEVARHAGEGLQASDKLYIVCSEEVYSQLK
ncbi:potassium channel protein [Paenibacillus mucilaginosus 3016]|uniref:Potassium channel protein n=2 Tax=Paenibacillus mucilaginosus TaxID=61624 RepID=H6NRS4_9BACL|nr:potassium channel family protein [Paenibacillus mucilaginosus]AFC32810.1 potassium channel protein [Paenibacillus mucilaginosus 3016]AFH65146.1 potassium channel protein [Paenibacillus mucilaginosus K02]WFA21272.1 potassium channel protein [Paenibacillus mucilaginosus]